MRVLLALCLGFSSLFLQAQEKPRVLTTFSILADMTRQLAGEHIELINLVGPDEDAHVFQPRPADAQALRQADLIIANGLGFEPWLERLLASSESSARRLDASRGVLPIWLEEQGQPVADPHAWQSLSNAELYVRNIS